MRKQCIFIGDRLNVLEEIKNTRELVLKHIFVLRGSHLHKNYKDFGCGFTVFSKNEKGKIITEISKTDFDILVSNGCPFILPVSKIKRGGQLFLNVHPSYLPDFRGMHPINAVVLKKRRYAGVTMHFMDNNIDRGRIIYQEKISLTKDLDLGLLYFILFDLEGKVFSIGIKKIIKSGYAYKGVRKLQPSSYYTRSNSDMKIDFRNMTSDEIIKRVRAFGVRTQGVLCSIANEKYRVFEAEKIYNDYLLVKFSRIELGEKVLEYDNKILMKSKNGIVKLKLFQEQKPA